MFVHAETATQTPQFSLIVSFSVLFLCADKAPNEHFLYEIKSFQSHADKVDI